MLITVGLAYLVVSRFSEATWIRRLYAVIYNYLGDVKLYQDYFARTEPDLEVVGEKSRVAIRRRMVRAVIQMAKACRSGELDGYFIIAHSLGTVVAYNTLMDAEDILPNYLTHEEWTDAALQPFKKWVAPADECALPQEPRRPPWLTLGEGLDRERLFEHLEGVFTIGSPLNKFAALWPAIVPMHKEPLRGRTILWVNVADAFGRGEHNMTYKRFAGLLVCGALALGTTALAQSTASSTSDIQQDRKDIRKDKKDIQKDRKERDKDLREARKDFRKGNKAEAKEEMKEAKAEQKDINKDKRDLRQDKRDVRHDRREHHKGKDSK